MALDRGPDLNGSRWLVASSLAHYWPCGSILTPIRSHPMAWDWTRSRSSSLPILAEHDGEPMRVNGEERSPRLSACKTPTIHTQPERERAEARTQFHLFASSRVASANNNRQFAGCEQNTCRDMESIALSCGRSLVVLVESRGARPLESGPVTNVGAVKLGRCERRGRATNDDLIPSHVALE